MNYVISRRNKKHFSDKCLQHTRKQNVPLMLNWLGYEGKRFVQTLNDVGWEKHKTSLGWFK